MLIIKGYKKEGQNAFEIENILTELKKQVSNEGKRIYRHLFEKEVETIVDDISLGVIPRIDVPIYDIALSEVNQKIAYATAKQNETEYNFNVSCHVLFYENDTYFKINTNNPMFKISIKTLEDVSLSISESEEETALKELWEKIMAKYRTDSPLGLQLYPDGEIELNDEVLKFRPPNKRAKDRARHNLTNRYLAMYAQEKEIPNYKLMEYMDLALTKLTTEEAEEILIGMETVLVNTLPNITLSMIKGEERDETDSTKEKIS